MKDEVKIYPQCKTEASCLLISRMRLQKGHKTNMPKEITFQQEISSFGIGF